MDDDLISEASWSDLINEADEWQSRQFVLSEYRDEVNEKYEELKQERLREEQF